MKLLLAPDQLMVEIKTCTRTIGKIFLPQFYIQKYSREIKEIDSAMYLEIVEVGSKLKDDPTWGPLLKVGARIIRKQGWEFTKLIMQGYTNGLDKRLLGIMPIDVIACVLDYDDGENPDWKPAIEDSKTAESAEKEEKLETEFAKEAVINSIARGDIPLNQVDKHPGSEELFGVKVPEGSRAKLQAVPADVKEDSQKLDLRLLDPKGQPIGG